MAGNDNGDRVGPIGPADRAWGGAGSAGDIGIAPGLARRDSAKRGPDAFLEIRPFGSKRKVESGTLAVEIFLQLIPRLAQQVGFFLIPPTTPIKRDNGAALFRDGEFTKGGMERELRHGPCAKWHHGRVASSGAVLTADRLGAK